MSDKNSYGSLNHISTRYIKYQYGLIFAFCNSFSGQKTALKEIDSMVIESYEQSERGRVLEEFILANEACFPYQKILILPIPTTKDGKTLNGTGVELASLLDIAEEKMLVLGYDIPQNTAEQLRIKGAVVCDCGKDEKFLEDNAELTALAALGILITSCNKAISDMKIGVVGYGRIGKRLSRMLLYLGADLTVFTSKPETRLKLCEFGLCTKISAKDADLSGLDCLINTAPQEIFDTENEERFPLSLRVIDLASGENFNGRAGVEKYPSVPAKLFPYSSGKIWYESVCRGSGAGGQMDCEAEK